MKETLPIRSVAVAAIVAIPLIPAPSAAQESRAITVYVARKIVTMDPGWPVATAIRAQREGAQQTRS